MQCWAPTAETRAPAQAMQGIMQQARQIDRCAVASGHLLGLARGCRGALLLSIPPRSWLATILVAKSAADAIISAPPCE